VTTRNVVSRCARALALSALVVLPSVGGAQLIPIKTIPLADGDQFNFFPASNAGMAGVGIALADSLLDPFLNPAKAARLTRGQFFGSPSFYSLSRKSGGGRTLPLGAIVRSGSTFAGLLLAFQEVDPARNSTTPTPIGIAAALPTTSFAVRAPDILPNGAVGPTRQNKYAYAMVGRALGSGLSLGASAQWDGLRAIDGTDVLYAGNSGIDQRGDEVDLRLGLLKEWKGDRSLEAVVLHNRFGMTHDVSYLDMIWDPATRSFSQQSRTDHNVDKTNTWGAQLAFSRPVGDSGWRFGASATTNLLSHPKIPNYQLAQVMSIPRDPGHSAAYDLGLGVSKTHDNASFALEAAFEPILSHTWAQAEEPLESASGATIPSGAKTVENHFRFANAVLRSGVSQEWRFEGSDTRARLQLGIALRAVHYWVDQLDHVQEQGRSLEEHWTEWSPTWGLSLHFTELEIRYVGRAVNGSGRPGQQTPLFAPGVLAADASSGRSVLAVPNGPMALDPVRVTTHQVSVSLPIH
jgi:hypothetical protein